MPGSIAPRVMAWHRRMGGIAGPLSASGEASNGEPVQVEMYIDGSWVDITSYVLVRDSSGNLAISRGRRDEGSTTEHSTLQMQLDNRDARWSPRNPSGPYYGKIGRNTPVRVSVPDGLGGKSYRFQGEMSSWPQGWDPTGTDVWTDAEASGIIRRLSQGPPPTYSVLRTALTGSFASTLLAYWPMEDAEGSATLASGVPSGSPMVYTGTPTLASYSDFPSSDPVPSLTGTAFTGGVASYSVSNMTGYQMRFLLAVPENGFTNLDVIARLQVEEVAAGVSLLNYFDIHYNDPPGGVGSYGGPGTLSIQPYDGDEAAIGLAASTTLDVRGRLLWVSLENTISGTTLTPTLRVYDIRTGVSDSAAGSLTSTSLSRVKSMSLGPDTLAGDAGVADAAAGHLILQSSVTSIDDLGRALYPNGEAAGRRIQRICAEQGIQFESIGDLDDTVAMGGQGRQNPLELMRESELADDGMLYESHPVLGLGYRTRNALSNQDAQLTLNYTGFNLSEVPVPVEDDRYIQNQVTVTVGEASETYALTDGTLSTELPPAGVGIYGTDVTLNLENSSTALSQAAWRVHLGTVDEPRYPQISVNLAHSSFTSNPALKHAVLGLRQGDRIVVQNLPAWLPPGDVDQIILGFDETITHFEHRVTFICAPASPYNSIAVADAAEARVDIDSELVSEVDSSATELVVKPEAGATFLWTTTSTDWPFDVRLGGEVVRVTEVGNWVTDTFTRSETGAWGTADTGQEWSVVGGTVATDFSVSGSYGIHTLTTVNASRRCGVVHQSPDVDVYVSVTTSATATGGSLYGGPVVRYIDANNMYFTRIEFTTANAVLVDLRKRDLGTESSLGTYTTGITHVAGTYVRCRLQVYGTLLRTKVWAASSSEPIAWHVEVRDTSHITSNYVGGRSIASSANTNVNPEVRYDEMAVVNPQTLTVTRSINGVTKSHAAGTHISLNIPSYVSL